MKVLFSIQLVIVLVFFPFSLHSEEQPAKPLLLSGPPNIPIPPWSWVDHCTGENVGYINRLMSGILEKLAVPHRRLPSRVLQKDYFYAIYEQLNNNTIDAVYAFYKTENVSGVVFSEEPVAVIVDTVTSLKSADLSFDRLSELRDKKGLLFYLSTGDDVSFHLKRYQSFGLSLTSIPSLEEAYRLLLSGQYDYILGEKNIAALNLKMQRMQALMAMSTVNETEQKLYFTMSAVSPWVFIVPEVDRLLRESRENGFQDFLKESSMREWFVKPGCQSVPVGR